MALAAAGAARRRGSQGGALARHGCEFGKRGDGVRLGARCGRPPTRQRRIAHTSGGAMCVGSARRPGRHPGEAPHASAPLPHPAPPAGHLRWRGQPSAAKGSAQDLGGGGRRRRAQRCHTQRGATRARGHPNPPAPPPLSIVVPLLSRLAVRAPPAAAGGAYRLGGRSHTEMAYSQWIMVCRWGSRYSQTVCSLLNIQSVASSLSHSRGRLFTRVSNLLVVPTKDTFLYGGVGLVPPVVGSVVSQSLHSKNTRGVAAATSLPHTHTQTRADAQAPANVNAHAPVTTQLHQPSC